MSRIYSNDTKPVILKALETLMAYVAPTLGASNNKILIDNDFAQEAVDDGVTIVKNFELEDELEDAVIQYVKDTSQKTNERVGDGTTTSMILLHAIIKEVFSTNEFDIQTLNEREVIAQLKVGAAEAVEKIKAQARPISTLEDIERVCLMSFQNPVLAKLVAGVLDKVGKAGTITLEEAEGMETTVDYTRGFELSQGYISPYMATENNGIANLKNPHVLLVDDKIETFSELRGIMQAVTESSGSLLIVAHDYSQEVLQALVMNRLRGVLPSVAVKLPRLGNQGTDILADLAVLTSATVIKSDTGKALKDAKLTDLGKVSKVIATGQKTTLIEGADILSYVKQLEEQMLVAETQYDKDVIQSRINNLTASVAIIKIGAPTQNEIKALKYKVEDAVAAGRAAIKGGVVKGAGLTFSQISTSSAVLNKALIAPVDKIIENSGLDATKISLKVDDAFDAVTGKTGNYFELGIVDPADVLIAALESAVSTASILISLKGIIANKREKKDTDGK